MVTFLQNVKQTHIPFGGAMNKFLPAAAAITFLFASNDYSQTVKKPAPKTPQKVAAKEVLLPAEYEINATVLKGSGIFILGINPTPTYPLTNESAFRTFLQDHFGVKSGAAINVKRQSPKIVIKFMGDDDITTIAGAAHLARVSDKAVVELEPMLERGLRLIIAKKPSEQEKLEFKPNPLTLVVAMNDKKELGLNGEAMGTLSNISALVTRLKEVYDQREKNGVFRENSYDVEKTIFIRMPPTALAADLMTIAKALESAGADRIGLQIDELEDAPEFRLEELPPIPAPKKKKPNK
jgi:biopolymer transport protein ExbD